VTTSIARAAAATPTAGAAAARATHRLRERLRDLHAAAMTAQAAAQIPTDAGLKRRVALLARVQVQH